MSNIDVSVIMLTYNRIKYLPLAVESVLKQTFVNWELIIIDGGSDDGTEALVEKYHEKDNRIIFVKKEKTFGITKCRNLGIDTAQGRYVAVLDSDDVWTDQDKLKKQMEFLENNSDCILLGDMAAVIDEGGKQIGKITYQTQDEAIRSKLLLGNQFIHSSIVYKKDAAQAIGGYGFSGVGEDYDFILKIGLKGKFYNLSDELVNYRRHLAGATWENRAKSARDHLSIIKNFRGLYPNYYLALAKAYLRIILATLKMI